MNSTQLFSVILLCAAVLFILGGAAAVLMGIESSKWAGASPGFLLYGFLLFIVALIIKARGDARYRRNPDED